ncbi:MAG: hypothetical protein INR73_27040 [Williamsia sp.]|nr:hypothetical protein [Williamsia sp.]
MLKNNFKLAWYNPLKDQRFIFLNLLGLFSGLACTLLIYLWMQMELGAGKVPENDGQLYQAINHIPNREAALETSGSAVSHAGELNNN